MVNHGFSLSQLVGGVKLGHKIFKNFIVPGPGHSGITVIDGRFGVKVQFPPTGGFHQTDQPEGLQGGSLKPPEPVGIPWDLMQAADMSFSTSAHRHSGHCGDGSPADSRSASKQ